MLFDLAKQLDALTNTLRLVSNVIVPVEPGQKVELKVLSAAPDLFVTDKVLDNPLLAGTQVRLRTDFETRSQPDTTVFTPCNP